MTQALTEITETLASLSSLAARPLAEATAMPKAMYTAPAIAAFEQERIFNTEWICIGRADDVAEIGDYMTTEIGSQPLIIIRGDDHQIKALSNVCRHRMMQLVEGRGNAKKFTCPYHAWTYHRDGRLLKAPYMDKTTCFDQASIRLPETRCEVYEGWIYVSLDQAAIPVAERLAALTPLVSRYRPDRYITIFREEHVWQTNWKSLTENFMEGYHLPVAHRGTVGAYFPVLDTEFDERGNFEHFTYQYFTKKSDVPVGLAHPNNTTLTGKWRKTSIMPTVFPSHMYVLAPDHLWYLSLHPEGGDQVRIIYGAALAPEVLETSDNREALITETKEFLDRVQEEDRFVVEGIFKGAQAPMASPGPLSWLERENHEFVNYLARKLCSKDNRS